MFELDISINGKAVQRGQFGDELLKAVIEDVSSTATERIESARCPVHQEAPKNIQMKMVGDKMEWTFEACCEKLEQAVGAMFDDADDVGEATEPTGLGD